MRTFVAVEITDPDIISGIEKIRERLVPKDDPGSVRPVDAGKLHFTLQFLGEVPDDALGRISDALHEVRFAPFDLRVGGVGAFPNARSPRAVWVGGNVGGGGGDGGSHADASPLHALAQKVAGALGPLGYAGGKPFKPHSTIFRVKRRGGEIAERLKEMSGMTTTLGTQRVDRFKLKKSRLTPDGPIYMDLAVINSGHSDGGAAQ